MKPSIPFLWPFARARKVVNSGLWWRLPPEAKRNVRWNSELVKWVLPIVAVPGLMRVSSDFFFGERTGQWLVANLAIGSAFLALLVWRVTGTGYSISVTRISIFTVLRCRSVSPADVSRIGTNLMATGQPVVGLYFRGRRRPLRLSTVPLSAWPELEAALRAANPTLELRCLSEYG